MTPLDAAHAEMEAAEGEAARRAFWGVVAASELHLWLAAEATGGEATPETFEVEGAEYALAFDQEDRLAAFAGGPAPYLTLPGRRLSAMLAQRGLGLGLNFGAPSQILVPPEVVTWLVATASAEPRVTTARPSELARPSWPPELLATLDRRLAAVEGLARRAWLASAVWADGRRGHLLAVEEAAPGAALPVARFVAEALSFSGDGEELDVVAVPPGSPLVGRLDRLALRFDLPEPAAPAPPDPARPPRLR